MASLNELAYEYKEISLMRKMFNSLKLNSTLYLVEDNECEVVYSRKKSTLRYGTLTRVFGKWKTLHREVLQDKLKMKKIVQKFREN